MELVNEWFRTNFFRKIDTPFIIDYTYEKELTIALPLTGNALNKSEMEYNGKFGHNLVRTQDIALMSKIEICHTSCFLANQTVAPTLPSFQGIKICIQYLDSHPNKTISILIFIMMDQISSYLHGVGIKLKTKQPQIV